MRLDSSPGFGAGVRCDLCGSESRGDFTYYSLDHRAVAVSGNRQAGPAGKAPVVASLDACAACVAAVGRSVSAHYVPTAVGVNCDLCGATLRGTFTYYYVDVSEVSVSMSTGLITCRACGLRGGACKCATPESIRVAAVSVNDKYLQVVACQRDHLQMVESAAKQKTGSTTSGDANANREATDQGEGGA